MNVCSIMVLQRGALTARETDVKKSGVNKSAAIRDYAAAHPSAKPREIVAALHEQGISVTSHIVSQVLYNSKKQGGAAASRKKKRVVRKAAGTSTGRSGHARLDGDVELLFQAKQLADMVGGIDRAKTLLNHLAKLRD